MSRRTVHPAVDACQRFLRNLFLEIQRTVLANSERLTYPLFGPARGRHRPAPGHDGRTVVVVQCRMIENYCRFALRTSTSVVYISKSAASLAFGRSRKSLAKASSWDFSVSTELFDITFRSRWRGHDPSRAQCETPIASLVGYHELGIRPSTPARRTSKELASSGLCGPRSDKSWAWHVSPPGRVRRGGVRPNAPIAFSLRATTGPLSAPDLRVGAR